MIIDKIKDDFNGLHLAREIETNIFNFKENIIWFWEKDILILSKGHCWRKGGEIDVDQLSDQLDDPLKKPN